MKKRLFHKDKITETFNKEVEDYKEKRVTYLSNKEVKWTNFVEE